MSMCNLSSPQGLWMTLNQFQLILLIFLTGAYIPLRIVDYLSSLKATTCSFNFIPFKDIPGLNTLTDWLSSELPLPQLEYFGLLSGSAFVNNFSLIWIVVILIIVTLIFLMIYFLSKPSRTKYAKISNGFDKIYKIFLFDLYIRLIFEANQFMVLSSCSELYKSSLKNISGLTSFIVSISIMGFSIAFNLLAAAMIFKNIGSAMIINCRWEIKTKRSICWPKRHKKSQKLLSSHVATS